MVQINLQSLDVRRELGLNNVTDKVLTKPQSPLPAYHTITTSPPPLELKLAPL